MGLYTGYGKPGLRVELASASDAGGNQEQEGKRGKVGRENNESREPAKCRAR